MIGFFEEAAGERSMTRLCAFLLTVGVALLFVIVAVLALLVALGRTSPDLAAFVVKIVEVLVGAIATVTGGMWAALHERN